MKKFAVIFLSVVMVLALTTVAFGAPTVSGSLKYKYSFQGATSVDGATATGVDNNDSFEGALTFAGVTANPKLSYFVTAKAKAFDNKGVPTDANTAAAAANADFNLDEYYAAYTDTFGTVKVGLTGYKVKGPYVDILDAAYCDLKGASAIQYSTKIADAIDFALFYNSDYYYADEPLYDNAYAVKVGYNKENWGVEGNIVNIGNRKDNGGKAAAEGRATGYTVNAYYKPLTNLALFVSVGQDQKEDPSQIAGVQYLMLDNQLKLQAEIDNDYKNGDANTDNMHRLWGVKAVYAPATGGIEYEFGQKQKETLTGSANQRSECYVSAKVKF